MFNKRIAPRRNPTSVKASRLLRTTRTARKTGRYPTIAPANKARARSNTSNPVGHPTPATTVTITVTSAAARQPERMVAGDTATVM